MRKTEIVVCLHIFILLLGAFTKLRKLTISFVICVCLSALILQLDSHWTDFHEIW